MQETSNSSKTRVWHPFLLATWPLLTFLVRDSVPGDANYIISNLVVIATTALTYLVARLVIRDRYKAGVVVTVSLVAWLSYATFHSVVCQINESLGIEFLRSEFSAVRHRYTLVGLGAMSACTIGPLLLTRISLSTLTRTLNVAVALTVCFGIARIAIAKWTAPPFGIHQRIPWTTSQVTGSPDPPSLYQTVAAFEKLKFNLPLAMTSGPGSKHFFVAEQFGKIYSFANDPNVSTAELMLEVPDAELYGLALHPQFEHNGYVFVSYLHQPERDPPRSMRVSRFRATGTPPQIDPATETLLLQWRCDGHHGGCLQFGPDQYLYVSTGDGSGIADEYLTAQDLSKLPGSILRIDVDHASDGRAYAIPSDNPFVTVEGARGEIWAYGLREPWKITFDRASGDLWASNVGQDLWETILRIERGGNYGWSLVEGTHPFQPERQRGPTPILPPVIEHDHSQARSLTGGYVYHGSKLNELQGAYIYADYDYGKVWSLRFDGTQVTEHQMLVDSSLRIVGFAEADDGELYLLDHMGGTFHQLAKNPAPRSVANFPRKLSETGLFASTEEHVPAPGVIPYSINAPSWSDGASKQYLLALPDDSQIEFDAMRYPSDDAPAGWKFPDGTVVVETISLEMETGNPASRRRLETRILHHERLAGSADVGDQSWRGYTYIWNDEQTDADLLEDSGGLDRKFTILDPNAESGQRQQTWHFPSQSECAACHNMAAKYVIAINTMQCNKDHVYGDVVDNQLRTLEHLGVFQTRLPAVPSKLPRLASYNDHTLDVNTRARSYLHANCAHCHRYWGGGNADFQLLASLSLDQTKTVDARPRQGKFRMSDARIITPGDPSRSVLAYRMETLGSGRMPRIGSHQVDTLGVNLIHRWIQQMPTDTNSYPKADSNLELLLADGTDEPRRVEAIHKLLSTTSGAMRLTAAMSRGALPPRVRAAVLTETDHRAEPLVSSLFERFRPEQQRTKRLGSSVDPNSILAMSGNRARGEHLFFSVSGVTCKNCHRVNGVGSELGPDLSEIGKKSSSAQILESILLPSKQIDPLYQSFVVITIDGHVHTGLVANVNANPIEIRDAEGNRTRILAEEIEAIQPQTRSMMPDQLLQGMTAQDVADLLAYLSQH